MRMTERRGGTRMVSRIGLVRILPLLLALLAIPASAVTVDRIAAVIDAQVITVSEIAQMVEIRFFPRLAANDDDYRRDEHRRDDHRGYDPRYHKKKRGFDLFDIFD